VTAVTVASPEEGQPDMDAKSFPWPQRAVSARELSRRMSQLLDEMHEQRLALLVLRYGRPEGLFIPINDENSYRLVAEAVKRSEAPPDIDGHLAKLDEKQRRVLADIAKEAPALWRINDASYEWPFSETLVAVGRLELAGLIERLFGNFRTTSKGETVAAALDGDQVSVRSAADREG
jgi:hypothetical protein